PGDPPPVAPPWPLLPRSRRRAGFQARLSRACNPCLEEADMTAHDNQTAPTPQKKEAGPEPAHGAEIVVPLNRLKAAARSARKVRRPEAAIEARAASMRARGVLRAPVVEIERDRKGVATGSYLVTIGEGRRQALRLLVKRKAIKRTHPVRV